MGSKNIGRPLQGSCEGICAYLSVPPYTFNKAFNEKPLASQLNASFLLHFSQFPPSHMRPRPASPSDFLSSVQLHTQFLDMVVYI